MNHVTRAQVPVGGRMGRLRAGATTLFCAIGLMGFAWFTMVTQGFAAADEAWFLQVVSRVRSGDTLYRDVYFNATPLSIWLTSGLASIVPTELLLVRGVVIAALFTTIALCWLVCRELQVGRLAPWLLVCAWTRPAPYTPVAMALFVATFYATLVWVRHVTEPRDASGRLVLVAILAALCFVAKQNLGLYGLGALVATVLVMGDRPAVGRRVVIVLTAFVLTCLAFAVPLLAQGAMSRLIVYGFANKGTYLELWHIPLSASVDRFRQAVSGGWSFENALAAYREFAFLLPVVAFALLLIACLRNRSTQRQKAVVVTSFVAAGYLVVYPGLGSSSLMYAIPLLIVGIAFGWESVRPLVARERATLIEIGVSALLAIQIGVRLVRAMTTFVSPEYTISTLPHFRGVAISRTEHVVAHQQIVVLSRVTSGGPTMLLSPNAGFYYVAAGVRNPDAYDFPYASVYGPQGQGEVIARITNGTIRSVFVFNDPIDRQTPVELLDFIRVAMTPVHQEAFGTLYVGPSGRTP